MNVYREVKKLDGVAGPLHLAIGVFDGIHRGHQKVIDTAIRSSQESGGRPVVVTFDPHPSKVLAPEKAPRLLCSTEHKIRLLQRLGIREVLIIPFTKEFAETEPEQFLSDFLGDSQSREIALISVGSDFRFGKNRVGDLSLLEGFGKRHGIEVTGIETVEAQGSRISSTRIRHDLLEGSLASVREMLGRNYSVLGEVIEGQKKGRTIGFPTANMDVDCEQLPATGVYAVIAKGDGDSWNGVANVGYRPTVEGGLSQRILEAHLFGLDFEIYGAELEIEFVAYLRPEKKFDSLEELTEQIARDARLAKAHFE